MTTNVQGSASSIGMAPATGASSAGALPSLTTGAGQAGAMPPSGAMPTAGTAAPAADPAAQAQAGGTTAPAAAAPAGFDINTIASSVRYAGPVMAAGGGVLALKGASMAATAAATGVAAKGAGWLKWGGIAAALGGLALTGVGFKAKGIETGRVAAETEAVAAINQLNSQYESTMQGLATEANTQITGLQQQLALAQQQGSVANPELGPSPAPTGIDPTAPTSTLDPLAQLPPTTNPDGTPREGGEIVDGATPGVGIGLNTTVVPTDPTGGTTASAQPGAWTPNALVGFTSQLAAGVTTGGTPIAEAGNYRIEQAAGDPNGYATLEEANAAARSTMSTELMGSKFLRWMVVEHGGRFYGAIAKQLGSQDTPKLLTPDVGNVVAWSAMNHVTENGANGWQAYSWSQAGGAQVIPVPYGSSSIFANAGAGAVGAGPTTAAGIAPTVAPTTTSAGSGGAAVGGGSVTRSFDPASAVGRSFSINASSTAEDDLARGGVLQLQSFVDSSAGGFGTAEEAAGAARSARTAAGGGDQWARFVTLQGADNRFYVYQGSIVKRETSPLQEGAPMHVFGAGFAEYYDGASSSWKAIRDAA